MQIRVLIVDRDEPARSWLRDCLVTRPDVELVGERDDGESAIEAIRTLRPDLVLLEIGLPSVDGFGVLSALEEDERPAVAFVTDSADHALRAFDVPAIDYLIKPLTEESLDRCLWRAKRATSTNGVNGIDHSLGSLGGQLQPHGRDPYLRRVIVRARRRIVVVRTSEIDWIEAASNYVQLHAGGQTHTLRETMATLESKLDPAEFLRVHRSVIVRTDRIREIEPLVHGDYVLVLADGTRITSGRSYRARIRSLFR